ncbi:LuxR C-terminal-related transcriptional regulator, partial [Klebsiella pneumoniae]|uniref:LuxR C-terminal-related transcriptional regulator n=4 Tax=Klebsiella TaxID=570 RepID=UPI001D0DAC78
NGGKNSLNRLIRCVCGKKIGPDPRNFNQRVSLGRNDLLIRTFPNSGYVFVDFSRYNIRLFTNDKWIEYLIKTGLRIVLIADRLAQPLALYWKHRCQQILSIIYTSDTRNEIERKIHLSFLGQKDGRGYRQKLSAQEVLVLDLLLAEKSVKEIAQELQMAEKRIYAIKLSLQNKMGGRGKLNIILSG